MHKWNLSRNTVKPLTLDKIRPGTRVRISGFFGGWRGSERLLKLGIGPGAEMVVVSKYPLRGPVLVRIDESQIALGRGIARRILVEPLP